MSVFGDYAAIIPEMNLITQLTEAPVDFQLLPSTANVISIDMPIDGVANGQPRIMQRIQLIDTEQHWNVIIMPERIDVNYSQPVTGAPKKLVPVSDLAHTLIAHTVSTCKATYGRMAINLTILVKPESEENLTAFRNQFIQPLSYQCGKESVEWMVRVNTPTAFEIVSGNAETVNVFCTLSLQTELPSGTKFVVAQLDINTSQVNMTPRFNEANLATFKGKAIEEIAEIVSEIERKWNDAK